MRSDAARTRTLYALGVCATADSADLSLDDPIIKRFRIRDFKSDAADGLFEGVVDTGANAPVMSLAFAQRQGFPIYQLRKYVPIETANEGVRAHLAAVVYIEIYNADTQKPFWMKSLWYLLDSVSVDVLIDRRTMRLMGIECIQLNNESYRHRATISNVLTGEDDVFWDKLLGDDDLPAVQPNSITSKSQTTPSKTEHIGDAADDLIYRTFGVEDRPLTNARSSLTVNLIHVDPFDSETDDAETTVSSTFTVDDTLEGCYPRNGLHTRQLDESLRVPGESINEVVECPKTLRDHPFYADYVEDDWIETTEETEIEVVSRHIDQRDAVFEPQDIDKPRSHRATKRYLYQIDTDVAPKMWEGEEIKIGTKLSKSMRQQLHDLLKRYNLQIASHWADTGLIEGIFLKLDLKPGSKPFKRRPYRQSYRMMEEIEKQVKKLLEAGFIVPSNSEFASPVTMVPKKLVTEVLEWRMCIDYRMLNSMTVRDMYPLPSIATLHRKFHGNHFFTALDLRWGYHHVAIRPEDRHKTAFITHVGLYEFVRMSFGFVNAPGTFQRAMNYIFRDCPFVIVYLDDILILSATKEEHMDHMSIVFGLLERYNLKIRVQKCAFFQTELKYLGFILNSEGRRPDPEYVRRIWELKEPQLNSTVKKKAIERMIGMIQWLHVYIPRLSDYLAPISELKQSKPNRTLVWNYECSAALTKIKELVRDAPLLRHPVLDETFFVVCDASDIGVGAVLMQKHEEVLHPVEFWSKKFQKHELHWHVSEKELVSIVWSLEKWESYLLGKYFEVYTDHRNLVELQKQYNAENVAQKLSRWFIRLQQFDFQAHYIKGVMNVAADYLSRDVLMESSQNHMDELNPERSFDAKPLLGKRHVFFVDVDRDSVDNGDTLIRIADAGRVRHCYILSTPHPVNRLRRSPRIAEKQRKLQALRESARAAVGVPRVGPGNVGSSHSESTLTTSGVSRRVSRRNRSDIPADRSADPSNETDVDVSASRSVFHSPGNAVTVNASSSPRRVVVSRQAVDGDGDVAMDVGVGTEDEKQSESRQRGDDEDDDIVDDWNMEINRLLSTGDEHDRDVAALFDKDYSKLINVESLKSNLLSDAITCTLLKIVGEGADVLDLTLPAQQREDVRKGYYSIRNGLLYFRGRRRKTWRSGYVIPPKLRYHVLEYFHSSLHTMHQGRDRMLLLMNGKVFWRGMSADVAEHCKQCPCGLAKTSPVRNQGLLQLFPAFKPFEIVHLDVVGPMPLTRAGNRYILTMMDRYSRVVKLICLPVVTASVIAMSFRNHWLLEYGTPVRTLTDRGSDFTSLIMSVLAGMCGFDQLLTTSYHPETNGRLERFHRYLKERLRCVAHVRELDFLRDDDWDLYVPGIAFSYNVTPNRMTGYSPYQIIYGQTVNLPIDTILSGRTAQSVADDVLEDRAEHLQSERRLNGEHRAYIEQLQRLRNDMADQIRSRRKKYDAARKRSFDRKRVPAIHYKVNEVVYVDTRAGQQGNARKLPINRKRGRILDKIGQNVFVIRYDDGEIDKVNVARIYKPVGGRRPRPKVRVRAPNVPAVRKIHGKRRHSNFRKRERRRKKKMKQSLDPISEFLDY